jgi:hypothetical protein
MTNNVSGYMAQLLSSVYPNKVRKPGYVQLYIFNPTEATEHVETKSKHV